MKRSVGVILPLAAAWLIAGAAWSLEPAKPVSAVPTAQALIDEGWERQAGAWEKDEVVFVTERLEKALALDPDNSGLLAALAAMSFRRGNAENEEAGLESKAGLEFYQKGAEYAERSLAIADSSWAHYCAAINKGAAAGLSGITTQVMSFPSVRQHIEWLGKNDRYFLYGAYARFWIDCFLYGPDPVISIIGIEKQQACDDLDIAIAKEPRYLENYYYKARVCAPEQDPEQALAVIDQALKLDLDSFPLEKESNSYSQKMMRKLWKEKTGKDWPAR